VFWGGRNKRNQLGFSLTLSHSGKQSHGANTTAATTLDAELERVAERQSSGTLMSNQRKPRVFNLPW